MRDGAIFSKESVAMKRKKALRSNWFNKNERLGSTGGFVKKDITLFDG